MKPGVNYNYKQHRSDYNYAEKLTSCFKNSHHQALSWLVFIATTTKIACKALFMLID